MHSTAGVTASRLLSAVLLLLPALASAQTTQTVTLAWDYDRPVAEVQQYLHDVRIDDSPVSGAPVCVASGTGTACSASIPKLTGPHVYQVSATYQGVRHVTSQTIDLARGPGEPKFSAVMVTVTVEVK